MAQEGATNVKQNRRSKATSMHSAKSDHATQNKDCYQSSTFVRLLISLLRAVLKKSICPNLLSLLFV